MERERVSTVDDLVAPEPSGGGVVGVFTARLVDEGRRDVLGGKDFRELVVDVRYPAARPGGPRVAAFTAGEAAAFGELAGALRYGVAGGVAWERVRSWGRRGTPVRPGSWPVVVFSPGWGESRGWHLGLLDDLVSRGVVVVAVDHTHDAAGVEFPGGRVERSVLFGAGPSAELERAVMAARVADLRFVVARLDGVARRFGMDLGRVLAAGHGVGGAAAMQVAALDERVRGAVDLDGDLVVGGRPLDVAARGLGKPFLLVGAGPPTASWRAVMDRSSGAHSALRAPGADHASFSDAEWLLRGDPRGLVGWNRDVVGGFVERVAHVREMA